MSKTRNEQILAASDELHTALHHLGRAELLLQKANDVELGFPLVVLNNLAAMIRNLDAHMVFAARPERSGRPPEVRAPE